MLEQEDEKDNDLDEAISLEASAFDDEWVFKFAEASIYRSGTLADQIRKVIS